MKMSKTENAVTWMINTASNNKHGYDQKYRWGEKGDYDCSSAVITAWESAGVPVKTNGASYTGNMYSVFKRCGFSDVTNLVDRHTGSGLKRGDVLLSRGKHTAMFIGNGNLVEASMNEKGKIIGGTPGDQTGKEFWIHSYYNLPWEYVLRFNENNEEKVKKSNKEIALEVIRGLWGNGSERIRRLKDAGYNPEEIQTLINHGCTNFIKSSAKTNEEIAHEVIRGLWGNGSERIRRLRNAGYNPEEIRKLVNRILLG